MNFKNLIVGAFVLVVSAPASAALIFSFNSIALSPNTTDGLSGAANSTAIKNYMNSVVGCSPGCVSSVTGALATANYNADGFSYPNATSPETLGTTDGAPSYNDSTHPSVASPDKFIMNDDFGIFGATSHSITINFSSNLPIGTVVSFDWEIFADGNCGACGPTSGSFPDLDFYAGGVLQHTFLASVIPGYDPQGLGTASGITSFTLTAATNTLRWDDWPPEIGIDNLSIAPPLLRTIPEPSPLPLTGLALALLALVRWKARRGPAPTLLS